MLFISFSCSLIGIDVSFFVFTSCLFLSPIFNFLFFLLFLKDNPIIILSSGSGVDSSLISSSSSFSSSVSFFLLFILLFLFLLLEALINSLDSILLSFSSSTFLGTISLRVSW